MKTKFIIFFFVIAVCTQKTITIKAQVNVQDSLALVDLYNSTNGPSWKKQTNWLTGPVTKWYGITVTNSRVTSINLGDNKLTGVIPISLGSITSLNRLYLSTNELNGTIPQELGNLINLLEFSVSYNQLSGSIPDQLENLVNVYLMYLNSNHLSGNIPASFGSLLNLQILSLSNNKLSGSIPPELGNLSKDIFGSLDLSYNELSGSIPSQLGNLTSLSNLDLSNNSLSGIIPSTFGNFGEIEHLHLSKNQLSGTIPKELGSLTFEYGGSLSLSYNQLTGTIPPELGNLTKLNDLYLSNNQLSGKIPQELGKLVSIQNVDLSNNQLTGTIPPEFGDLSSYSFRYLNLSNNYLTGNIPPELGNFSKDIFGHLNLSNNRLTGNIPPELGQLTNLAILNLSNNQLTGTIPAKLGYLGNLGYLYLNHNKLRGSIPSSFSNLWPPLILDLSYNRFTFNGMELIAQNFPNAIYSNQAIIPVHQNDNLSVSAGGTLSNNTYKWFKVGQTDSTVIVGDSVFAPTQAGKYYAAVTNSICTELTLYTDTVDYTTLPVTIINLKAYQQGSYIKVDWASLTEIYVARYEIQRSSNASNFLTIGSLPAKGNGTQQTDYTYNDLQPLQGNNYYRLKAIDKDGKITYSKTVLVNVNDKIVTIVYPIPAKDILHIQTNGAASFSLLNQSGKILLTENINGSGTINVSNMAAGIYYLRNNSNGDVRKVIVIK